MKCIVIFLVRNFLNSNFKIIIIYFNRYYNNYDTILTHNIYLNFFLKNKVTMAYYVITLKVEFILKYKIVIDSVDT